MNSDWTFIDLFAGIGGFHIALSELGGECVFASEWDKNSKQTYFDNFNIEPHGDITKISENDIPSHDVLCAGFPCQAFSISGKQLGFDDTRGTLFFDVARIIKKHQPKIVFLENVKNFARHDMGRTLLVVKNTLEKLGYHVFYEILKSSHFGVPQARERVYFVCIRRDLAIEGNSFKFPVGSKAPVAIKNILEKKVSDEYFIYRDDIKITKDEKSIKDPYSPLQIGKLNKGGQGERIYSIEASGITLSAHGGGAAAKTGAYFINGKIRKLTPTECLRMQGFPKDFKLPASKNISYKQLGNSVSVPVIQSIFTEVLKQTSLLSPIPPKKTAINSIENQTYA